MMTLIDFQTMFPAYSSNQALLVSTTLPYDFYIQETIKDENLFEAFTTFIRILGFPILTESTLKQKRSDQATILKRWIGAFSCLSQLQLLLQNDVYS